MVVERNDGLKNALTGLGETARDASAGSYYAKSPDLSYWTLDALYQDDGLLAKLADIPANDALRQGFAVEGTDLPTGLDHTGRHERDQNAGSVPNKLTGGFDVGDPPDPYAKARRCSLAAARSRFPPMVGGVCSTTCVGPVP